MRWKWVLTWGLCAALGIALALAWILPADPEVAGTASSVAAAVTGLFGLLAVWAGRPGRTPADPARTEAAADALAALVRRQWEDEAVLRQLFDPAPLPVLWSDCLAPGLSDHRPLTGEPISCRADAPHELTAALRGLPRRRLVVLGPAGSGKTAFTVLLTLALLRDRTAGEPVPVLFSLASFDPSRESVHGWLRRRIAADYPALADARTHGGTVIEGLLADRLVLPVLDGLDELPASARAAALASLNDTLDAHAPLVVTCRSADYAAAVAEAGVLAGAAVVAPAPLRADATLALLRLATPPGPGQDRWDALATHLSRHPDGPAARALTGPLVVALARAVYADGGGDPAELADTARFPTPVAIEHHLLDALIPTLYARAHRRAPAGRRWDPVRAQRYLTHLAAGLRRQGTHDLAWWQLYRWLPALGRTWARAALWAAGAIALTLLAYGAHRAAVDAPAWTTAYILSAAGEQGVALWCMQCVAAWAATAPRMAGRRLGAAALVAVSGVLVHDVERVALGTYPLSGAGELARLVATDLSVLGLIYFTVLYAAGTPVPPRAPSRGSLTAPHWRRRLPRAVLVVAGVALLTVAALNVYVVTGLLPTAKPHVRWGTFWAAGLTIGALFGTVLACVRWVTVGTAPRHDVVTPAESLRADRLIALVNGAAGAVLITLADVAVVTPGALADHLEAASYLSWLLLAELPVAGAAGLVLALTAFAWPHYTLARLLLAARGRLPWRPQAFLADAHRLGVLRQVGPVHQFRHACLQERLAGRARLPHPRRRPTPAGLPSGSSGHPSE
ncbi:NACHT domain-containing protein [Streptomyces sp. NPDC046261]|uniref:NACHT domain-containing protein n=1 Tax=Streptomyces sp. NPDC046261 TaxID=3157200 RepID=UPI0033EAC3F6